MSFGIIRTNTSSIFTNRIMQHNAVSLSKHVERLNSGYRINRAADDAAGLTVSEKMRSQLYGLDQARRNTEDGVSMVRTAEGVLQTQELILHRLRTLAVQAANDNITTFDRKTIQTEIDSLIDEIDHVAKFTEFNTKKLLNGDTMGRANVEKEELARAYVIDSVVSADYSITVLDAGTACNIHGNANIKDTTDDGGELTLYDAGIRGDEELHIEVDGNIRVIMVNENDSLDYLAKKINQANVGVIAGLDAEGNDITITSIHSGSRFNINFGKDPFGVAHRLGLTGGNSKTHTFSTLAVDSSGNPLGHRLYTSGTDTIISITNVTNQTLFQTDPGGTDVFGETLAGGYGRSLGIFRSDSDIFTEVELSNPINSFTVLADIYSKTPIGQVPDFESHRSDGNDDVDLTASQMLKGLVIHIDENLDYGLMQRDNNDLDDPSTAYEPYGWTKYFPDRFNGRATESLGGQDDHHAAVPNEVETAGGYFSSLSESQMRSITSTKLSVRNQTQIFHVGANDYQVLKIDFGNLTAEALGLEVNLYSDRSLYDSSELKDHRQTQLERSLKISVQTQESAENAITVFDTALKRVSEERSKLGAFENSFDHTSGYLGISYEMGTESGIRNTDYAKEITGYVKDQILISASTEVLKKASFAPETVISLLQ